MQKKLELQSRVEGLQRDLAEVSKLTPGQLRAENGLIAKLNEVEHTLVMPSASVHLVFGYPNVTDAVLRSASRHIQSAT